MLESDPGGRVSGQHGGKHAGPKIGPEVGDLAVWGASRAGVPCAAREVAGVPEGARRQVFRILVFQKADIENCSGDDRLVP